MNNNDSSDQAPWLTPKNPPQQPQQAPDPAASSGNQPPAYQSFYSQQQPYQAPSSSTPTPPPSSAASAYPTAYGSTQYGNPYATPSVPLGYKPQSGLAIAALVTSLACIPIVGLVLSIMAMSDTKDDKKTGRGMAIAGLVVSIIYSLFLLAWVAVFIYAVSVSPSTSYTPSYTYTYGPRV